MFKVLLLPDPQAITLALYILLVLGKLHGVIGKIFFVKNILKLLQFSSYINGSYIKME